MHKTALEIRVVAELLSDNLHELQASAGQLRTAEGSLHQPNSSVVEIEKFGPSEWRTSFQ